MNFKGNGENWETEKSEKNKNTKTKKKRETKNRMNAKKASQSNRLSCVKALKQQTSYKLLNTQNHLQVTSTSPAYSYNKIHNEKQRM